MRRAAEQTAARWSHEADELTAQCPDFDLGAALHDARCCAVLRAGMGARTARPALRAAGGCRGRPVCAAAGRRRAQRVSERVRAGGLRPGRTNGVGSGGAGIVVRPDVSRMSRADRAELAARAERGERVKLSL